MSSVIEDPGVLGGIAAVIAAIGAVLRGEQRGRSADKAAEDAREVADKVRREFAEELATKVSSPLCTERVKRIEGAITALDRKTEAAFKHQRETLDRIESSLAELARRRGER